MTGLHLKLAQYVDLGGGWIVVFKYWSHLLCSAITTVCLLGCWIRCGDGAIKELKIGSAVRFGENQQIN